MEILIYTILNGNIRAVNRESGYGLTELKKGRTLN